MRYIYSIFLALLISFNSVAAIKPEHQVLADMLLSGNLELAKKASLGIYKDEISDPALLDIVAEILLRQYDGAKLIEIDTIAWLASALGSSENARYHQVLSEVIENSKNRKLVKYAEKALDKLDDSDAEQYEAGMYPLSEDLYMRETDTARDARILALVLAGDLSSLKQATKEIVANGVQNQEISDILAEILINNHSNASGEQIDTFAWVAKAIGQSQSGRYATILNEIEKNNSNRKLRKYAKRARKDHGNAQGEQYKQGMVDKTLSSYVY